MNALFGRKVRDLEELKELTKEAVQDECEGTPYEVTREVLMSDAAFREFAEDLLKDQSWIDKGDGGTNRNGEIRCIRVKNRDTGEKILVNGEGYDYPRYTALELE
ncbi:hypothetical protein EAL2_c19810 [Peptoclostridium acidaminophilum DSM 3953]|uniref:DUF6329 domain-containing protein n=1 Tax=Peptoclostridium acidaminophilum DSM 3953 TaxID=1286171 RepID=W8TM37_PEPAC|nr:DUF6329 domain-containing protein [Peptoclostridium acidaminophilum]AHM57262.1 hypothetical protein EAL2_c19810 [Peptoclostridium acidaminophilum DSM 3953]